MTTTKTIIRGGGNVLPFLNSTEPEQPTFLSLLRNSHNHHVPRSKLQRIRKAEKRRRWSWWHMLFPLQCFATAAQDKEHKPWLR